MIKAGRIGAAMLAGVLCAGLSGCMLPPDMPTILASATGSGPEDAYVVSSASQEYEILRDLGLTMESQSVHTIDGKAFDVLSVRDPQTQETRDIWFDISRFFGRGLS